MPDGLNVMGLVTLQRERKIACDTLKSAFTHWDVEDRQNPAWKQ